MVRTRRGTSGSFCARDYLKFATLYIRVPNCQRSTADYTAPENTGLCVQSTSETDTERLKLFGGVPWLEMFRVRQEDLGLQQPRGHGCVALAMVTTM